MGSNVLCPTSSFVSFVYFQNLWILFSSACSVLITCVLLDPFKVNMRETNSKEHARPSCLKTICTTCIYAYTCSRYCHLNFHLDRHGRLQNQCALSSTCFLDFALSFFLALASLILRNSNGIHPFRVLLILHFQSLVYRCRHASAFKFPKHSSRGQAHKLQTECCLLLQNLARENAPLPQCFWIWSRMWR